MDTSPQLAYLFQAMANAEPLQLPTPGACTAGERISPFQKEGRSDGAPSADTARGRDVEDFCLIPIGTPTASVSKEVAEVQRLLKKSGVKYVMHSAGTTLEGPWDQVMRLIGQCHSMLHANGVVRIQSDIRVGSRTDKHQGFEDKVRAVEELLAADRDDDDEQKA